MPLCAEILNTITDDTMREAVKARFWEVLVSGEMDPDRSQSAVAWWGTRGGKELVLFGRESDREAMKMMSGALPVEGIARESKLLKTNRPLTAYLAEIELEPKFSRVARTLSSNGSPFISV